MCKLLDRFLDFTVWGITCALLSFSLFVLLMSVIL